MKFETIKVDLEEGRIKVPQFQRDFIWNLKDSAKLLDSILKEYPVGSFVFWKTKIGLRAVKDIGGIDFKKAKDGEEVNYVLDGQQRITSLYAILKGATIENKDGKKTSYKKVFVNLGVDDDEEEDIVVSEIPDEEKKDKFIPLHILMDGDFADLASYPKEYQKKIRKYQKIIAGLDIPVIDLPRNADAEVATEVFTRLNTEGKALDIFDIMVARTYDEDRSFDLEDKWGILKENLSKLSYDTISRETVLQTAAFLLEGKCDKKTILGLDKNKFIDKWEEVVDCINRSVEHFRGCYKIPASKILSYDKILIPFAYFFSKRKDKPVGEKRDYLKDFFWRCSLGKRYSVSVVGRIAQDCKKIDKILNSEQPDYNWPIDVSPEYIMDMDNGRFNVGDSFIKSILAIYAAKDPRSFKDGSGVVIDNAWLSRSNSRNYHHFFPKTYLQKERKESDPPPNHVLNITFISDGENKKSIGEKAPSKYIREFAEEDTGGLEEIKRRLSAHHLIDIDEDGIMNDDYPLFFKNRAMRVSEEIKKRIIFTDKELGRAKSEDEKKGDTS